MVFSSAKLQYFIRWAKYVLINTLIGYEIRLFVAKIRNVLLYLLANRTDMHYIVLIIFLAVCIALQVLLGDFPVIHMSFPLNVILMLFWLSVCLLIWNKGRKSGFVRFMLSSGATFSAIGLLLTTCLVIGISGNRDITSSWFFVGLILYFQTVLLYVILRGWRAPTATGARLGSIRWRFLFLHVGILLTVMSAFWGAPDSEELRLQAFVDVPVSEAYHSEGRLEWLDQKITLIKFEAEYDAQGMPSDYEALLDIDGEEVSLRVNHPYSLSFGEDIYLTGFDTVSERYCILQIVREPWRYGVLSGIIMMLTGALMLFVGGPRRNYGIND